MWKGRSIVALIILVGACLFGFGGWTLLKIANDSNQTVTAPIARATPPIDSNYDVRAWFPIEDFDPNVAVFETVFWDPRDTLSLRKLIRESGDFKDQQVLEIGTGSGLLSLCCLKAGAKSVVATDVNPAAVENAVYNASRQNFSEQMEVRQVSEDQLTAFSTIKPEEQFDFIISNPPWVNQRPRTYAEYALFDEDFALMKSLFEGLPKHLKPKGRVLLAYGCVDAIKTIEKLAIEHQFEMIKHDSRDLDELPAEFLPGFLVELRFQPANKNKAE